MNFFEIDFLNIDADKSGDAIALRYEINGVQRIHVVDGGFQASGQIVTNHVQNYYGQFAMIDHVVATHPDGDHLGGLRVVLEEMTVGALWMLRPWDYIDELMPLFSNVSSEQYLNRVLREAYPNIVALEEIALEKGIPIYEPFQGAQIGAFIVMSPSRQRYLDLIAASDRTPVARFADTVGTPTNFLARAMNAVVSLTAALWGEESFSSEPTSRENEMSVVQAALLNGKKILLTADTGCEGLQEVINFAPSIGLELPGIDRFQVPHHGSRRNMSSELLDQILGQRLQGQVDPNFTAVISASKNDADHPRKAAIRAMIHRGGRVLTTEVEQICMYENSPARTGWTVATAEEYPTEQE